MTLVRGKRMMGNLEDTIKWRVKQQIIKRKCAGKPRMQQLYNNAHHKHGNSYNKYFSCFS